MLYNNNENTVSLHTSNNIESQRIKIIARVVENYEILNGRPFHNFGVVTEKAHHHRNDWFCVLDCLVLFTVHWCMFRNDCKSL